MSIRYNNIKLASANTYHPDLFDVKWSDHTLDNISWLRADTFSWHYGELYTRAYQHLVSDLQHDAGHDTINGIDIYYHLAPDGHKIVGPDHEDVIQQLYESTGVAWYYIVDEVNKRFKLPRTKYAFTGVRNNVGKFVEAGLPNITGTFAYEDGYATPTGSFYKIDTQVTGSAAGIGTDETLCLDASRSSSIYGNSNTVQPQATEMYLYFYVGNFAQKDITATYGPEFMAHQATPGDRYIDLTVEASLSEYTAPADGYFAAFSWINSNQNYLGLMIRKNDSMNIPDYLGSFASKSYNDSGMLYCHCPVKKGDVVAIGYLGGTSTLRFVYAEGSK